jgi:hypothetical protein
LSYQSALRDEVTGELLPIPEGNGASVPRPLHPDSGKLEFSMDECINLLLLVQFCYTLNKFTGKTSVEHIWQNIAYSLALSSPKWVYRPAKVVRQKFDNLKKTTYKVTLQLQVVRCILHYYC